MRANRSQRQPVLLVNTDANRSCCGCAPVCFCESSSVTRATGLSDTCGAGHCSYSESLSVSVHSSQLWKFAGARDVRQVCASLFCRWFSVVGFRRRGAVERVGQHIRARARNGPGARSYVTGHRRDHATVGRARSDCLAACRSCFGPSFASCTCSLRQRFFSRMPVAVFAGRRWQMRPDRGLFRALRRQRSKFRWLIAVCERALVRTVCCLLAMRRMPSRLLFALSPRLGFDRRDQMRANCVIHWAVRISSEFCRLQSRCDGGMVVDVWRLLALPRVTKAWFCPPLRLFAFSWASAHFRLLCANGTPSDVA